MDGALDPCNSKIRNITIFLCRPAQVWKPKQKMTRERSTVFTQMKSQITLNKRMSWKPDCLLYSLKMLRGKNLVFALQNQGVIKAMWRELINSNMWLINILDKMNFSWCTEYCSCFTFVFYTRLTDLLWNECGLSPKIGFYLIAYLVWWWEIIESD